MRPASMVLPKPTSSAMKRLPRGSSSALCSGSRLVRHHLNPRTIRSLEQPVFVDVTPLPVQGVEVGREPLRRVDAALRDDLPRGIANQLRIDLEIPHDI